MLLTATQIAEKINRPPTTVRDWGVKYKDYLPRKQKGRFFMYSELATEIFKRISELHSSGLTTEQVRETLEREQGKLQDGDLIDDNETTTTGGNSLVISQQYQTTITSLFKLYERQEIVISLLTEQNKLLKEKLGLNKAENKDTTSPKTNDIKQEVKRPIPTSKTKQKATKIKTVKQVKRVVKKSQAKRDKRGRYIKRKKSFWAELFS